MNVIIKTALMISALSCLYGILLTFSKRWLSTSTSTQINVNNILILDVETDDTLLTALHENNIQVPASCNSKGTCGECKVKITSSQPEFNAIEKNHLSTEEMNNGIRLSCQVKINGPMSIEVPESLIIEWLPCKIQDHLEINKYMTRITLKVKHTLDSLSFSFVEIRGNQIDNNKYLITNFDSKSISFIIPSAFKDTLGILTSGNVEECTISEYSGLMKHADIIICDDLCLGINRDNSIIFTTTELGDTLTYKNDVELAEQIDELIETRLSREERITVLGHFDFVKCVRKQLLINKFDHRKIQYDYLSQKNNRISK